MKKNRIIADPLLMLLTILVVAGFQVYWLKDNYEREKRSLSIKSNMAFQDAVRHLQTLKLKLRDPFYDTSHNRKMRVIVNDNMDLTNMPRDPEPEPEMITMINAVGKKVRDSLKNSHLNTSVIISMAHDSGSFHEDLIKQLPAEKNTRQKTIPDNKFFKFLYGVDSLQDSLKIPELRDSFKAKMNEENLSVPFTISRVNQQEEEDEPNFSNVTVGFAHPVTYHLELGNTFPYLIRRISLPILFSIFLVGITVLSFSVLYRNVMKQRRLAELKNEFIGNITHELKTPIATVGVAIEALKNFNAMQDPQRTREYLDISANELQRLSLLVDKVLKLSMFEKKEIDLKFEPVDLRELVNEVVSSMRLQIEKFHANVSVTQDGDMTLEADRLHLLSVVFNLLDNALKYGRGEQSIHFDLVGTADQVEIKISDNGIGIAPEYKKKIFEKFFRVPTGNTHNAKGYGLGLSYVAQVVEKHRGQIAVESELDKGTSIRISIPKNHT